MSKKARWLITQREEGQPKPRPYHLNILGEAERKFDIRWLEVEEEEQREGESNIFTDIIMIKTTMITIATTAKTYALSSGAESFALVGIPF